MTDIEKINEIKFVRPSWSKLLKETSWFERIFLLFMLLLWVAVVVWMVAQAFEPSHDAGRTAYLIGEALTKAFGGV